MASALKIKCPTLRGICAHVIDTLRDWSTFLLVLGKRCLTTQKTAAKETFLDLETAFFISVMSTPSYFCGNIKMLC